MEITARLAGMEFGRIVIVDDGSGASFGEVFDSCSRIAGVELVRHPENLGKGAALKSGIRHILTACPDVGGVVTADADGQHECADIARVAARLSESPGCLVLGSRRFGRQAPWRSRVGNALSRHLVRLLVGHKLKDTQTGLRGIPHPLLAHLLEIGASGYEFELDMLIAARHHGIAIEEVDIRTVYEPGNPSSHFDPLVDSLRVWFVLFRFTLISLATALLDNLVFLVAFAISGGILESQVIGRAGAVLFNYSAVRRTVFRSRERHRTLVPRYILLVIASGLASYSLILLLRSWLALPVAVAKITAESVLFLANFFVQREFVFRRREAAASTDWGRYHAQVPLTARLTRRYTAAVLVRVLKRFTMGKVHTVVELGGGGSCFMEDVCRHLNPREYHAVDTSADGLESLRSRSGRDPRLRLHQRDVLALDLEIQAGVAFSVGLVEHFDPAGTRKAIEAHLRLLRPAGIAVISAPTPTWLYRAARSACELFGIWRFPDERPVSAGEIRACVRGQGEILFEKTLWPLVFTQRLVVIRKSADAQRGDAA